MVFHRAASTLRQRPRCARRSASAASSCSDIRTACVHARTILPPHQAPIAHRSVPSSPCHRSSVPASFAVSRNDSRRCRHRAANEAEVDPVGALEADRLERCRDPTLHVGEVRGEHHVAAPLPHLELVGERARRLAEVGAGDHVEHNLPRRADRLQQWPERLQPATDVEVERQRSTRQKPIVFRAANPSTEPATSAAPGCLTWSRRQPQISPTR